MTSETEPPMEREVGFLQNRLRWLDQEITRYRDYEWKATSFHAAFFTALLYILLDPQRHAFLVDIRWWLFTGVIIYLMIACSQLVYIHWRLNQRRSDRSDILEHLGHRDYPERITRLFGLWEGLGAIFPIGFLIALIFLGTTALMMLLR